MNTHAIHARERVITGCGAMEQMLRELPDSKGRVAEQVHGIRKLGKSLRGGFILFGLGSSSAKEIQAIGRLLAAPRDAVSRLATWDGLAWKENIGAAPAIRALLVQHTHSAARKLPSEALDWCLDRVTAARSHLEKLPREDLGERVRRGLHKLERRVAKHCGKLQRRREEDFHEARKTLKAYLGAIGYLPDNVIVLEPKWLEIPELLGDENDIATLSVWLDNHGFTAHLVPTLWNRIHELREKFQTKVAEKVSHLDPPGEADYPH